MNHVFDLAITDTPPTELDGHWCEGELYRLEPSLSLGSNIDLILHTCMIRVVIRHVTLVTTLPAPTVEPQPMFGNARQDRDVATNPAVFPDMNLLAEFRNSQSVADLGFEWVPTWFKF